MSQGNNNYLNALALLIRAKNMLKEDKREQLNAASLAAIQQTLVKTCDYLRDIPEGERPITVMPSLLGAIECIGELMNTETYAETDTELKELLYDKVMLSLPDLYMYVGKYYMTHDFIMDPRHKLDNLLIDIIDTCIGQGYYFGELERIKESEAV